MKELGKLGSDEDRLEYLNGLLKLIKDKKIRKEVERLIDEIKKPREVEKPKTIEQIIQESPVVGRRAPDIELDEMKYEPRERLINIRSDREERTTTQEPTPIVYAPTEITQYSPILNAEDELSERLSLYLQRKGIDPTRISGEQRGILRNMSTEYLRRINPAVSDERVDSVLTNVARSFEPKYEHGLPDVSVRGMIERDKEEDGKKYTQFRRVER